MPVHLLTPKSKSVSQAVSPKIVPPSTSPLGPRPVRRWASPRCLASTKMGRASHPQDTVKRRNCRFRLLGSMGPPTHSFSTCRPLRPIAEDRQPTSSSDSEKQCRFRDILRHDARPHFRNTVPNLLPGCLSVLVKNTAGAQLILKYPN